jgi:hypothetical protein
VDTYQVRFWKDQAGKKHWHIEERGIAVWHGTREHVEKEARRLNRVVGRG